MTPLCLDLARKKNGVRFVTFLGGWAVKLLKEHLASQKLEEASPLYNVSARNVHAYFRMTARENKNLEVK